MAKKNKLKNAKVKKAEEVEEIETSETENTESGKKDPRIKDKKATQLGNERLVNNITKENMIIYFLTAVIPPVGLYMLWKKENTIPYTAKVLWTMIGIAVIYGWVLQLTGQKLPVSWE